MTKKRKTNSNGVPVTGHLVDALDQLTLKFNQIQSDLKDYKNKLTECTTKLETITSENNDLRKSVNIFTYQAKNVNDLSVSMVTLDTPILEGSDSKLASSVVSTQVTLLNKDFSNFRFWEQSMRSTLSLLGVSEFHFDKMLNGQLRPSSELNSAITHVLNKSLTNSDEALQDLVQPYILGKHSNYILNSGLAIFAEIKRFYMNRSQNRNIVLLERLKKMRFMGQNLLEYNTAYKHTFNLLLDARQLQDSPNEIKHYIDSLGNDRWISILKDTIRSLPQNMLTINYVFELAEDKFLVQYPNAQRIVPNIYRVNNNYQNSNNFRKKCFGCGKNHPRFQCPAQGKTCSFCGIRNHLDSVCMKKQRQQKSSQISNFQPNRMQKVKFLHEPLLLSDDPSNDPVGNSTALTSNNSSIAWQKSVGFSISGNNILVDSGASVTITSHKDILMNFHAISPRTLETAGNNSVTVTGTGILPLHLKFGLISVPCYYTSELSSDLTILSIKDLLTLRISVIFNAYQNLFYLSYNGIRHYLKEYNKCFILSLNQPIVDVISTRSQWLEWHRRLAHASPRIMKATLGNKYQVEERDTQCVICDMANITIQSYQIKKNYKPLRIQNNILYVDFKDLPSASGYVLHLIYDGWLQLCYILAKEQATNCILDFISSLQRKPKRLIADRDTPFKTSAFKHALVQRGVRVSIIPPLHHQLNHAEPRIRYSMATIRSILLDLSSQNSQEDFESEQFLPQITQYVAWTMNRIGTTPSPYYRRYNREPNLKFMKPFFADCVVPKLRRPNNLQPKGLRAKFVGYASDGVVPTCLLWIPDTGRIITRAFIDCRWIVRFPDSSSQYPSSVSDDTHSSLSQGPSTDSSLSEDPAYIPAHNTDDSSISHGSHAELFTSAFRRGILVQDANTSVSTDRTVPRDTSIEDSSTYFQQWHNLRDTSIENYGTTVQAGIRRSQRFLVNTLLLSSQIAYGYDLLKTTPDVRRLFTPAIISEVKNVFDHDVLRKVDSVPSNKPLLNSQFVLTIKRSGKVKARWVVCGNQQESLDVIDYYSATINRNLIFLLLHIAFAQNLVIKTLDVTGAYLYGKLPEGQQVFIRSPFPMDKSFFHVIGNMYGLKQAGYIWNSVFTNALIKIGFTQSVFDPCLFYAVHDSHPQYLLIHVDDGLLIAHDSQINHILSELSKSFAITVDEATDYLGFQILQSSNRTFKISQHAYINKILKRYNMDNVNSAKTPLTYHLTLQLAEKDKILPDATLYRSMLGSLSFLRYTRPDLLFAINELSRVASSPDATAMAAMKRAYRYLKGTKDYYLQIGSSDSNLRCYFDAGFAAGTNQATTLGHIIYLGTSPILFTNHTLRRVADSSAHAEAYSMHAALKDVLFIQNVCKEISYNLHSLELFTDSQALHDFSFKSGTGKRSRHWELILHFMKQYIGRNKEINLRLISATDNVADIFTKALGNPLFHKFITLFMTDSIADSNSTENIQQHQQSSDSTAESAGAVEGNDFD